MNRLNINPKDTIESIGLQFGKHFPFLKIECFRKKHESKEGSPKKLMYPADTVLSVCMNKTNTVTVTFNTNDTVKEFEEKIYTAAGLNIQVFRKSGKLWLETTVTDNWTLQQQNEEGEKSGSQMTEEIENINDHDIY